MYDAHPQLSFSPKNANRVPQYRPALPTSVLRMYVLGLLLSPPIDKYRLHESPPDVSIARTEVGAEVELPAV
jgi:hypothetical protein